MLQKHDEILVQERYMICHNFIVIDEKWFYRRPLGSPSVRTSWIPEGGDVPTYAARSIAEQKFMVIVAVKFDGAYYQEILDRNETVNSTRYIAFLDKMMRYFQSPMAMSRCISTSWESCYLQHDNARPHKSHATEAFLEQNRCKLVAQAAYSPDLNICDRFIFPKLEMERAKLEFQSKESLNDFLHEHL